MCRCHHSGYTYNSVGENLAGPYLFYLVAIYWAIIDVASSGTSDRYMALTGTTMRQDIV